jgi:hypothetical protein
VHPGVRAIINKNLFVLADGGEDFDIYFIILSKHKVRIGCCNAIWCVAISPNVVQRVAGYNTPVLGLVFGVGSGGRGGPNSVHHVPGYDVINSFLSRDDFACPSVFTQPEGVHIRGRDVTACSKA